MCSGAKYLQNGTVVEVEDNGGLIDAAVPMDFLPGFSLEGWAHLYPPLIIINYITSVTQATPTETAQSMVNCMESTLLTLSSEELSDTR